MSHTDYDAFRFVRVRHTPLSPGTLGLQCRSCETVVVDEIEPMDPLELVCLYALEHVCADR